LVEDGQRHVAHIMVAHSQQEYCTKA